ncbi:putative MFS-type transporter YhcA [Alicyclobacillus acidoterrestris]|uniref:DHA2 family efflux MFS transporter permease subunit n=1 Tax=Alicyclobacillus suci TaxID=2816080 RepID=UPI001190572D|nr:DHA2 family efflux MFS transporter permease subunit [Alicyclobacillus suci]GEO26925.1 putative MFS-type transporter YhcA [Alicyclobacillus acidoterrestris]
MSNARTGTPNALPVAPIFGVMIAGAFIAFLNQTLINVALPQMMDYLHITATTGDWLTTIYMLVNGVVIPITAFLMERFTTRQLYITSMSLFALGTLVCAIGPNFSLILVGRVIQAGGAGILMPLLTNVIFTLFPPERRGGAMGILGIALNFAPAIGPTLSGWIVEHHSWRLLFFIILPIAIADIIVSIFVLKNVTETKRPKLDSFGVALSTIGFGGILYGFSVAGSNGWGSIDVIVSFIVGGVSLIFFVWRQLVVDHPILEFRIFRYPMFTLTTLINVIVTMALYAGMILMPLYMQDVRGFSPLLSGLMLLPGGVVMGVMSPITGKLYDRFGARWLAAFGLAVTAVTTFFLARLQLDTTYLHTTIIYTIRMFGMSILMMPIMTAGLNQLPLHLNRYGTALLNTLRMVSGAVGMAFLVTIMSNRATMHIKDLMAQGHVSPADKAKVALVTGQGTVMGINDAFLVATGFAVAAFILSLFIRRTTPMEDIITNRRKNKKPRNKAGSNRAGQLVLED